ncbi:MAG: sialidase family protein [Breznakibacter sp.]
MRTILFLTALLCLVNIGSARAATEGKMQAHIFERPLIVGKSATELMHIAITTQPGEHQSLQSLQVSIQPKEASALIQSTTLYLIGTKGSARREMVTTGTIKNGTITFNQNIKLTQDTTWLAVYLTPKSNADLDGTFRLGEIAARLTDKTTLKCLPENSGKAIRMAYLLRAAGEDHCHTYRIPGFTTTDKGTLIAVFDNRYENSKDLQGKIKIGMSRSTDGGKSWEPMKVVMDMKNFGGQPESLNGVTDPSVLFDAKNKTIWVAAMWLSGGSKDQMAWWASKPGMLPTETGQFMLVKSTDDGLTWSEPIIITEQIKDPKWQLLLQGPGKGISMGDGTLVFPAQFKEDIGKKAIDGGQYTCHSTIVYSRDGGKTWQIGTGAKDNTTESQVVELSNGSLMLNMRDDLNRREKGDNNGRAVATTTDLGKTWQLHPSSNSTLQEPNCMASLIAEELTVNGQKQKVLFFSNPNNKYNRTNMTIKASMDEGFTWPAELQINEDGGFGYSCMTMVDDQTIGIIYEGSHDIIFQRVKVSTILKP